jgi:hypothetical protein
VLRRHRIHVRLDDDQVAQLDELRGPRSRPEFLRALLRTAGPIEPQDPPNHAEAVDLLRQAAIAGSITARVALERALRANGPQVPSDADLEELLQPSS